MDGVKLFIHRYRSWLIVAVVILLLLSGWTYYNRTAWERELTVKYIGSENWTNLAGVETRIYTYEITNNTNRALRDVVAIFKCYDLFDEWKYFDKVGYIAPGQTVEYKAYKHMMLKHKGKDLDPVVFTAELERVKYKK